MEAYWRRCVARVIHAVETEVRDGGVSASKRVLQISEGSSETYEAALRYRPDDTVTVSITGTAGPDVRVNPASLTFTADNWSTARTVTVSVAADADSVSDPAVTLVHQPSGGGYDGAGGDLVTVLPGEADGTLTATLTDVPAWHSSRKFGFRVSFNREVAVTETAMRDEVFAVTGGTVSGARHTAPPSTAAWEVEVQPVSSAAVTVSLPPTSDCAAAGAVCTGGGLKLAAGASFTVSQEWKVGGMSTYADNGEVQVRWSLLEGAASYKVQWKSGNCFRVGLRDRAVRYRGGFRSGAGGSCVLAEGRDLHGGLAPAVDGSDGSDGSDGEHCGSADGTGTAAGESG